MHCETFSGIFRNQYFDGHIRIILILVLRSIYIHCAIYRPFLPSFWALIFTGQGGAIEMLNSNQCDTNRKEKWAQFLISLY